MGHVNRNLSRLARRSGPAPLRATLVRAGLAVLVGAVALWSVACNSGSSGTSAGTSSTPMSATIPPGYSGSVPPGQGPTPTGAGGSADVPSAPTSVLPENQALCEELQKSQGLFSGPVGVDDATALRQMKETFSRLAEVAPTGIKPEVQGMSNTIQGMGSVDDVERLADPNFTAYQERFAEFVLQNCGFQLVG